MYMYIEHNILSHVLYIYMYMYMYMYMDPHAHHNIKFYTIHVAALAIAMMAKWVKCTGALAVSVYDDTCYPC